MANKAIIIKPQDTQRVVGQAVENTSLAAGYFKNRPLHNSTHISSADVMREYGNVPVVLRGDSGIRPKHGVNVSDIVPMPIEIDDVIRATEIDDYERATEEGKNQIIDRYLAEHFDMIRATINALCCQAHKGKIDYMMKSGSDLVRYQVNYGDVQKIKFGVYLNKLTISKAVFDLTKLRRLVNRGVGGPVEFVAAEDLFARYVELLEKADKKESVGDGYLMMGPFKVFQDNDSYVDIKNGAKVTKSLCEPGEIVCRAVNGGQKLPFCKLDDTVQREAVPFYSFTEEGQGQRGTSIYSKSKPFPLPNLKAIAWGKYEIEQYAVTFSAGSNGALTAKVDGEAISSGDTVPAGTLVYLYPVADSQYVFDAWAGADASEVVKIADGEYTLYVDKAKTVQATFKAAA